jgi:putative SOS response-associated peptidase YedK
MCGRYTLTAPDQILVELGALLAEPVLPDGVEARYNLAPTQLAPVIANREPRTVALFRWGLVPSWADDLAIGNKMINARAESLAERPAFRDAFARRRCLVPADGFFEWQQQGKHKQPMWIHRRGRGLFTFAGLWDRWKAADGSWLHSFTIVTCPPTEMISSVHDRMPVIVEPVDRDRWLAAERLPPEALADILQPSRLADLVMDAVSSAVNKPANDGPECIAAPAQGRLF